SPAGALSIKSLARAGTALRAVLLRPRSGMLPLTPAAAVSLSRVDTPRGAGEHVSGANAWHPGPGRGVPSRAGSREAERHARTAGDRMPRPRRPVTTKG